MTYSKPTVLPGLVPLWRCDDCGAVVAHEDRDRHEDWHERLARAFDTGSTER